MEVIRHGKYKSAVEPFLENEMSDANREQTAFLNSIWIPLRQRFQKVRRLVDKLNEVCKWSSCRTPEMAKETELVDIIAYEDYIMTQLKALKWSKVEDYNKSASDYTKKMTRLHPQ
jgi:protease-4